MSQKIPLTRGLMAIVDDEDYPRLAKHKWCLNPVGSRLYAARHRPRPDRGWIYMHREIVGVHSHVDHINGNGLDNRRANLRAATPSQNGANASRSRRNRSGFKGVRWAGHCNRRNPWQAQIGVRGTRLHLGYFDDPQQAAKAYDRAAINNFGAFARTNAGMGLV